MTACTLLHFVYSFIRSKPSEFEEKQNGNIWHQIHYKLYKLMDLRYFGSRKKFRFVFVAGFIILRVRVFKFSVDLFSCFYPSEARKKRRKNRNSGSSAYSFHVYFVHSSRFS